MVSFNTLGEVLLIALAIFAFVRFLRGTHGKAVVQGLTWVMTVVMLLFAVFHLFRSLETELPTLNYLAENLGFAFGLGVLILLQPELRQALTNLGQRRRVYSEAKQEIQRAGEIAAAARHLAERRRGALIAIERQVGLRVWTESGIAIDSRIRNEILAAIFETTTSVHDGGVIISGDRIVAAGCVLPLSEDTDIAARFGTRHRAAIGLSERTDAIVVVVSEETGQIGLATEGKLEYGSRAGLSEEELRERLIALLLGRSER